MREWDDEVWVMSGKYVYERKIVYRGKSVINGIDRKLRDDGSKCHSDK